MDVRISGSLLHFLCWSSPIPSHSIIHIHLPPSPHLLCPILFYFIFGWGRELYGAPIVFCSGFTSTLTPSLPFQQATTPATNKTTPPTPAANAGPNTQNPSPAHSPTHPGPPPPPIPLLPAQAQAPSHSSAPSLPSAPRNSKSNTAALPPPTPRQSLTNRPSPPHPPRNHPTHPLRRHSTRACSKPPRMHPRPLGRWCTSRATRGLGGRCVGGAMEVGWLRLCCLRRWRVGCVGVLGGFLGSVEGVMLNF